MNRQAGRHADKQIEIGQVGKQKKDRQTDRHTDKEAEIGQTGRNRTDRQVDRETNKQGNRWTERQTDRQ